MLNVSFRVNQVTFYHLPKQQRPYGLDVIVHQRPRQIAAVTLLVLHTDSNVTDVQILYRLYSFL